MTITAELLLRAYADGYFPMAEHRNAGKLYWFSPDMRGIIPFERFHIPRRLQKTLKQAPFEIRLNTDFRAVMEGCAEREETWINDEILSLFSVLHEMGFAHSVECWQEGALAGGVYGIALGGAFFAESMFSRARDASKVALCHLVTRLKNAGYTLFDTQYLNDHLTQFGAVEIPKNDYLAMLKAALNVRPEEVF